MAFKQISAPVRSPAKSVLSADNGKPDRFTVIDTVRRTAAALNLAPPIIATLDALLSCLPPARNHDLVFASNATLVMRRNGISDRTLRRHLADLITAGLLTRIDSPNGKRYAKRDPEMGTVLRFGLDLSPLFAGFDRLRALAQAATVAAERLAYLRTKLRAALARTVAAFGETPVTAEAYRALRRKLGVQDLETWLSALPTVADIEMEDPGEHSAATKEMSASNGQNVRQQQNSKKETIDEKANQPAAPVDISLADLAEACPQACEYMPGELRQPADVVAHARRLAPMMGIDALCYEAAERRLGPLGSALTVWGLLEMQGKIQQLGAYFRAVTSGKRCAGFSPWQLIDRLLKQRQRQNCPRTIAA